MTKWVGLPSFTASTSTSCNGNLGHHPSRTRYLTFDYYDVTNNEAWEKMALVRYQFDLNNDFNQSSPTKTANVKLLQFQCVRLDQFTSAWTPLSCQEKPSIDTLIKCGPCNVSKNVIISYVICSELSGIPVQATYIVEGISAFFLLMTSVFLLIARLSGVKLAQSPALSRGDIRTNKFVVQFCACLALLSLHVFVSVAVQPENIQNTEVCHVIASGLHFTILAAAIWLLNQGISLFFKISDSFSLRLNYKILTGVQSLFGWGLPLLIVGLIKIVSVNNYVATNQFSFQVGPSDIAFTGDVYPSFIDCTFNRDRPDAFYSVIVTLAIIIVVNIMVTIYTIKVVHGIKRNDAVRRHVHTTDTNVTHSKFDKQLAKLNYCRTTGKALLLLVPASAIPWLIWMFALIGRSELRIAFTCSSGLQGIAIFFIFCVVNSDDRERIRISWSRSKVRKWLHRAFDVIFRTCQNRPRRKTSPRRAAITASVIASTQV